MKSNDFSFSDACCDFERCPVTVSTCFSQEVAVHAASKRNGFTGSMHDAKNSLLQDRRHQQHASNAQLNYGKKTLGTHREMKN